MSWLQLSTTNGRLVARRRLAAPLALIGSPLIAIPVCVSGVDLPMIGLSCLSLACAARGRRLSTAISTALACAFKWTAWPLLPIALALLSARRGRRTAMLTALLGAIGTGLTSSRSHCGQD